MQPRGKETLAVALRNERPTEIRYFDHTIEYVITKCLCYEIMSSVNGCYPMTHHQSDEHGQVRNTKREYVGVHLHGTPHPAHNGTTKEDTRCSVTCFLCGMTAHYLFMHSQSRSFRAQHRRVKKMPLAPPLLIVYIRSLSQLSFFLSLFFLPSHPTNLHPPHPFHTL